MINSTANNTKRDNTRRTVQTTLNQWMGGGNYINPLLYPPIINPTHNSRHALCNNCNLHRSQNNGQTIVKKNDKTTTIT